MSTCERNVIVSLVDGWIASGGSFRTLAANHADTLERYGYVIIVKQ